MKKWISLLLAGILVSAFMVGCNKEPEGSTTTPPATGGDGKMEEKKGDTSSTEGENKGDESKMASAAGDNPAPTVTDATPPTTPGDKTADGAKMGDAGAK